MSVCPKHLTLEITRHCNYNCPFCYCVWHEFPALARRDMPLRRWQKIIAGAVNAGVDDILFTGGEVLKRKDIADLIKYTRKLLPAGQISLFTNASLLTEEKLRFFRRYRVHLATSLPGLTTYSEMTGTRRTCYPLLRKIARAKELKWPIQVSMTVTKVNAFELSDMFCAAALSGAESIQVGAVMLEGKARKRTDLALTRQEWELLKEQIRNLPDCRTSYSFCDEMICTCREQSADYLKIYGQSNATPCSAGKSFGVIGPDGSYRKCLHIVDILKNPCYIEDTNV